MNEETGELSNGIDNHLADHAGVYTERMRDQAFRQSDDALLKEIEDALNRMKDGTYGTCETTGKEIPYERLEAIPYARRTAEAQAEAEARQEDRTENDRQFTRQMKDLTNKETMDQNIHTSMNGLTRNRTPNKAPNGCFLVRKINELTFYLNESNILFVSKY